LTEVSSIEPEVAGKLVHGRWERQSGPSGGGPAEAAGLSAGAVITRVNEQVISDADALVAAVQSTAPGATIAVNYLDPSGGTRIMQVLLGADQGQQS
jgi:putative serine protease PepD